MGEYCELCKGQRCNWLLKKNLKIGGGLVCLGPPVGSLGNAPCGGPGQKQHSQGFDVLKASKGHYRKPISKLEVNRARSIN